MRVKWNNPTGKTVFVYLNYSDEDKSYERILSSSGTDASFNIRGLEEKEYNFSYIVEDFNGNKTDEKNIGMLTPLLEQKIEKSTWTLVKSMSANGDKYEGRMENHAWPSLFQRCRTVCLISLLAILPENGM